MPVTAAGAFRLEAVKLTSADGTGYSGDLLTGAAVGTLVTRLQIATQSSAPATPQGPGVTSRVAVYLYDGSTYYEYGSFNLQNAADTVQWVDAPTDLVLISASWRFRFAVTKAGLLAGCDLVFTCWGRDIS